MIGKIIGAFAGAQASKYTHSLGGTGGAIAGAIAVSVIRRIRWPVLLALGAGGYAVKKQAERDAALPKSNVPPPA